jgi:hypothetical protein
MILCLAQVLIASVVLAAAPKVYQFSADMVTATGGQTVSGKMIVNTDKMRMEMSAMGQSMITIVRRDKNVSWMLMPAQKMYMEMSLQKQNESVNPFAAKADYTYTLVGAETVDGHPCKKYSFETTLEGKVHKGFHWLATDLKDFPVKWSDEEGTVVTELKNVKLGSSEDSLFELPAGYQKMTMPAMKK